MKNLKTYFITGIVVLLPLAASFYVLAYLFKILDGMSADVISIALGKRIPGLGVVLTLFIVLLVGFLATNIIGRTLIGISEKIMYRIPIARSIYRTVKQIVDSFYQGDKKSFKKVVLVEYPRRDMYSLGFLTGDTKGEAHYKTGEELLSVFIPTTPNPTSGYLLLVPRRDVIILEMSVEDGLKKIISGGVVVPPYTPGAEYHEVSVCRD